MADTYTVERSTSIEAPPQRVYPHLADLHRWQAWSPWEGLDPELQREYSGPDTGTGAVYTWSGNKKAGAGRMEVIEAVEPSLVRIDLRFEKPFKSRSETRFTIEPDGAGTRVTWTMTGRLNLMMKVFGVFKSMDSLIGPDFEKGLAALRQAAEQ